MGQREELIKTSINYKLEEFFVLISFLKGMFVISTLMTLFVLFISLPTGIILSASILLFYILLKLSQYFLKPEIYKFDKLKNLFIEKNDPTKFFNIKNVLCISNHKKFYFFKFKDGRNKRFIGTGAFSNFDLPPDFQKKIPKNKWNIEETYLEKYWFVNKVVFVFIGIFVVPIATISILDKEWKIAFWSIFFIPLFSAIITGIISLIKISGLHKAMEKSEERRIKKILAKRQKPQTKLQKIGNYLLWIFIIGILILHFLPEDKQKEIIEVLVEKLFSFI